MHQKRIHNILICLSFLVPFIIYFKTMAPTVSLWDCGEFISTSIMLGIPHPPGTPLYLIIGNFFSQLPILDNLGARVNIISPIASALSIMFLYMIIVYLIQKFSTQNNCNVYYAAFIGALTFSITDSQWFNAVEAEVYALSTLFTAIVVWLILKWERTKENKSKYLILIFYCIGLAIGIHLLNLLALPFIGLIVFFKYLKQSNTKINLYNSLLLIMSTSLCFIIIYKGIIKGVPSILNKTQNPLILYAFFIIIVLATILINIKLSQKFNLIKHISISAFALMMLFITINELVITNHYEKLKNQSMELKYQSMQLEQEIYQKIQTANNVQAQEYWIAVYKKEAQEINNKITLIEPEMDDIKNNGLTYFNLLSKQSSSSIVLLIITLGATIIILSYYYKNSNQSNYYQFSQLVINCTFMILLGYSTYALIFIRAQQNPHINYNNPHDIKSAYEYINRDQYGQWDIFDRKTSMLINSQQNHESWKRYTKDTQNVKNEEITKFVWNYQFKEMYLRYFAWQFIGKEKWGEKTWNRNSIDNEPLMSMPPLQGIDVWRYGVPLAFLIGMLGIYYHFRRDPFRAFSVFTLFVLTGIAIVIYLNQSDPQPRERDYAYVGSFFAFSIWIGIGCYGLISNISKSFKANLPSFLNSKKDYSKTVSILSASLLFMLIPFNMCINDYYEHDRSQRYEAWDYAYNLLNSCDKDGILFTNGDNDTFPLWYLQFVEKIRTDVKVVNLSLLNFPSYIKQLDQHSPSLNLFSINPFIENEFKINEDDEFIKAINSENINDQLTELANKNWLNDNYPNVVIETPKGIKFDWTFKNGTYGLGLTNITIMNIIEKCFDKNPIYFSVTTGNNQLGLDDYLLQEGLVYKLTNKLNDSPRPINMNLNKTILLLDSTYKYTNLNKTGIFYGPHIERIVAVYRNIFQEAANHMVVNLNESNNIQKSFEIIEKVNQYIPNTVVPEMEQMALYRQWEYYDSIIRYCMFMKEYGQGIPNNTIIFIQNNMPELYNYLETQFPELIILSE